MQIRAWQDGRGAAHPAFRPTPPIKVEQLSALFSFLGVGLLFHRFVFIQNNYIWHEWEEVSVDVNSQESCAHKNKKSFWSDDSSGRERQKKNGKMEKSDKLRENKKRMRAAQQLSRIYRFLFFFSSTADAAHRCDCVCLINDSLTTWRTDAQSARAPFTCSHHFSQPAAVTRHTPGISHAAAGAGSGGGEEGTQRPLISLQSH